MAVRELLRTQETCIQGDGAFKIVLKIKFLSIFQVIMPENNDISVYFECI